MPCCGSAFYLPVDEINVLVPLFIVLGLVLFSSCSLARFPSLSAGSESLGGVLSLFTASFEFCHRWSLLVWLSGL